MSKPALALALALTLAGCGMAPHAVMQRASAPVVKQSKAVTLESAVAKAVAFAGQKWGGSWTVVRLFGDDVWGADGKPTEGAWRVNLLGKIPGNTGAYYLKLAVAADGTVTARDNGPFPDPWHTDKEPALDMATQLPAEQGLAITLASRLGLKFVPQTKIAYEAGYADRLKRTVVRYKWRATVQGTLWYLEVCLDPKTGELVEEDASHI